jgi:hypothetical protein
MNRPLAVFILFALVSVDSFCADLSPEQEHLNHYVGEWDGTISTLPNAKVSISCEWILNGTFLRHSLSINPPVGATALQLMTYDKTKGIYRAWSFYSDGRTVQGEGKWDDDSKIFTWTNRDDASQTTTVTKVSFPSVDSESTVTQIMGPGGEVVSEIRGTKTRRK